MSANPSAPPSPSPLLPTGEAQTSLRFWPTAVLVGALVAALGYWLWFGLTLRTIDSGDGISILAVQGVLDHGYQRLPSGYTYGRGFLSHYLVAGAAGVFGLNNFSLMLPSLLLGLGGLVLAYRIAADILHQPWLGVAAVVLLISLAIQTWYATGPRMYMPLQFFTLLATYAVWRGYVEGEGGYKAIALLALVAGTLSNQQGAVVALALPLAVMLTLRLRGDPWSKILSRGSIATVLLLGAVTFVLATYRPSPAVVPVIGHHGVDPARIGLNLDLINWGRHVLHFERSAPYSLGFALVGLVAVVWSVRGRRDPSQRWTYVVLAFTLAFLTHGAVIKSGGHRLIFFLIPLYALVVCGGVWVVFRLLTRGTELPRAERRYRLVTLAVLAVGVGASVILSTLKQVSFTAVREGRRPLGDFLSDAFERSPSFAGLLRQGYGLPCAYGWRCDRRMAAQFASLRQAVDPDDLVISMLPMETSYLLGRLDGWLFFRAGRRNYPTLEGDPRDEYFGVPIVDTPAELRDLATSDRRVWIITKLRKDVEPDASRDEMWRALDEAFARYQEGPDFITYVAASPTGRPLAVRSARE